MYFSERVEFVSRSCRRRDTALKKDSWIVGRDEEAEEVLVVLFFWVLVVFEDLLIADGADAALEVLFATEAIGDVIESFMDEVILVRLDAAGCKDASEEIASKTAASDCEVAVGVGGGDTTLPADGGAVAVTLSASSSTVELRSDSRPAVLSLGLCFGASEDRQISMSCLTGQNISISGFAQGVIICSAVASSRD